MDSFRSRWSRAVFTIFVLCLWRPASDEFRRSLHSNVERSDRPVVSVLPRTLPPTQRRVTQFFAFLVAEQKKVSEKPKQMWKVLDKLKQFHRKLMVSQDKLLFRINYSCWAIVRGRNFLLRLPTKRCEKVEDGSLGSDKKDLDPTLHHIYTRHNG